MVYDSVPYLLQPLESGLGTDIVSHGHGQQFEMCHSANFTCTVKIYFKHWFGNRMLSSSKWRTTIKDLMLRRWEKYDVFTENRRDPNRPWLLSSPNYSARGCFLNNSRTESDGDLNIFCKKEDTGGSISEWNSMFLSIDESGAFLLAILTMIFHIHIISSWGWWTYHSIENLFIFQTSFWRPFHHVPFRSYSSFENNRKIQKLRQNQPEVPGKACNQCSWVHWLRLWSAQIHIEKNYYGFTVWDFQASMLWPSRIILKWLWIDPVLTINVTNELRSIDYTPFPGTSGWFSSGSIPRFRNLQLQMIKVGNFR